MSNEHFGKIELKIMHKCNLCPTESLPFENFEDLSNHVRDFHGVKNGFENVGIFQMISSALNSAIEVFQALLKDESGQFLETFEALFGNKSFNSDLLLLLQYKVSKYKICTHTTY